MDLRSGYAYWPLKNGLLASYPALKEDVTCDVAIIGGGVTGALVAHHLAREGVATVLLDKRDVATGSTAASTSLLQYGIDTELVDLIPLVGEYPAVRSYQLGLEAIIQVEALLATLGDPCGFQRKQSLYLASHKSHLPKLQQEYECRRRFGFKVEYLDAHAIEAHYSFSAPGAILCAGDAVVDVFRFTHALLRHAQGQGLRVYDRTAVTQCQRRSNQFVLRTDRECCVRARRVVFATGYESQQYLKASAGTLHSTFAAISEPMEPFPAGLQRCLIWETARPYYYLRATDDNRVIVGGADLPFAQAHRKKDLLERRTQRLVRRFQRMFPEAEFEVAYAWAGTFGESKDGLAYIGQSPEWPNAYFALGYGGNGITMSMVAAQLITDDYLGRKNPDAVIFRFDR